MNLAELARKLHISLEELRMALPRLGFDIGARAIKVDDRVAWKIIEQWPQLKRRLEQWRQEETKEEKSEQEEEGQESEKVVKLPSVLTVREFAARLNLGVSKIITELMKNGILASLNERLDYSTAAIIAEDLGFKSEPEEKKEEDLKNVLDFVQAEIQKEDPKNLKPRPPIVVVMGHIDHGKTKLLDCIRKTNVVAQEAGGITQHIGAYQAQYKDKKITFIDTPGHEAFMTMRSRGARVADLAILIVAADDGVQPQTLEALKIIRAANLPFLVALNKIDKETADPERVKSQLAEAGVIPEEWGGKIPFIPISAKLGLGIDNLLETLLILAELEKDKIVANPEREALGTIIESHLDPREGILATILVQNGTLHRNDYLVLEEMLLGKVRLMKDWNNQPVEKALPAMPVRVLGFKVLPSVGDIIRGKKEAGNFKKPKSSSFRLTPIGVFQPLEEKKEKKFLNLILKTDVEGSLEAILTSLEKIEHPKVGIKIISKGIGTIGESDVIQAEASQAIIYGFNLEPSAIVLDLAQSKGVEIRTYKIIYDLLDDIKARLESMLPKEIVKHILGRVRILKVFRAEKTYTIVGGVVEDGKALKNAKVNIIREGKQIEEGTLEELQSAKQPVEEVRMGQECGLKISTRLFLKEGDILEIFKEEEKTDKLQL
jgi:translation initiation factor IF-2